MKFEANIKNEELIDKLKIEIEKYEKMQKMIDKFPYFEDYIMEYKVTNPIGRIGNKYKKIHFGWGVNRYIFKNRNLNGFKLDKDKEYLLNSIYINPSSLYGRHDRYGLEKLGNLVFFFDSINTTFYATDEELPILLEALNDWYIKAHKQACIDNKEDRKKELQKKLDRLEKINCS